VETEVVRGSGKEGNAFKLFIYNGFTYPSPRGEGYGDRLRGFSETPKETNLLLKKFEYNPLACRASGSLNEDENPWVRLLDAKRLNLIGEGWSAFPPKDHVFKMRSATVLSS
jgi:hypothetical protein